MEFVLPYESVGASCSVGNCNKITDLTAEIALLLVELHTNF
jgi:hypothetical protein